MGAVINIPARPILNRLLKKSKLRVRNVNGGNGAKKKKQEGKAVGKGPHKKKKLNACVALFYYKLPLRKVQTIRAPPHAKGPQTRAVSGKQKDHSPEANEEAHSTVKNHPIQGVV